MSFVDPRTGRLAPQTNPTSGLIHAVNRFLPAPPALYLALRRLTQRSYQSAQTGETVCSYETTKNQFAKRFFNHAGQEIRPGYDVVEKRCAMFFKKQVNGFRICAELCGVRFGWEWIRAIPRWQIPAI